MTDFKMTVIHLDAPTSGTFPLQVSYSDSSGPAGKTPVAAIVSGTAVTQLDVQNGTARISYGFTDGTTQRCNAAVYEDNAAAASANASSFADTDHVFILGNNNGGTTPQTMASFVSFGTNEITLEWDSSSTATLDIVLFYGDIDAKVVSFASSSSVGGTASTTALSSQPDVIFGITSGLAYSSGGSLADAGKISFGFAARDSSSQASATLVWEDTQSRTSVGNINNNNGIVSVLDSVSGTVSLGTRLEVTAYSSNGFTVTTRDAAVSIEAAFLALNMHGLRAWAGAPLLPTSTSGSFPRTDPGFNPQALIFCATRTGVINSLLSTQGSMFFGYATDSGEGGSSVFGRDNQTTSDTKSHHSETYCGAMIQTSGGYNYRFSHTSFDATGWTGNVASTSASDQYVPYLAIERPVVKVSSDTEGISDAFATKITRTASQSEDEDILDDFAISRGVALGDQEGVLDDFAISRRVAFGDQEDILDDFVSLLVSQDLLEVVDEPVGLDDDFAISRRFALSEQEDILDAFVSVLQDAELFEDFTETMGISDDFAISRGIALGDQEDILDEFVSVLSGMDFVESTDTDVNIDDDFVAIIGKFLEANEPVSIDDAVAYRLLENYLASTDTLPIYDDFVSVLGTVFVSGDQVDITDDFNTGRGPIVSKSINRGCVFG